MKKNVSEMAKKGFSYRLWINPENGWIFKIPNSEPCPKVENSLNDKKDFKSERRIHRFQSSKYIRSEEPF